MRLKTKTRLANISIWIIVITISIVAIFFFGFLVSETFNLKVFTGDTSDFIWILFAASMVIVICGAFLNISLNIGIIADSKTKEFDDHISTLKRFNYKTLTIVFLTLVLITAFLFFGDYRSRKSEERKIRRAATEIIDRYERSIDEITIFLNDTSTVDSIPGILRFLCNQKDEFPSIILIRSDYFNEQLTYLEISSYLNESDLKLPYYNSSFYSCNENDCDYLERIFTTNSSKTHFWSEGHRYKLYIPMDKGEVKYVLLFSDYDRYGKYGS